MNRIIAIREKNVQRLEGEYTNNNPSTSARDKEFAFPVFTILIIIRLILEFLNLAPILYLYFTKEVRMLNSFNIMSNYSLKRFIKSTLRLESYEAHYQLMSILPPYLHQVIIGLLLSDGSLERPTRTGGARLSVILGINSLPYLLHLYNLFEPYIDSGFSISEVYNKKTSKYYDNTRLQTGMMPILIYYHDMFYNYDENAQRYIKRVPKNIDSLMTPVVLANLIMGDGNLKGGPVRDNPYIY